MRRKPRAELLTDTATETTWMIRWPSSPTRGGKAYVARTFKNGSALQVETAVKRLPTSELVSKKLSPVILAAIEAAEINAA